MINIVSVISDGQIREAARLADIIWREHYPGIIGLPLVEYMLANFQSEDAMKKQIAEGYTYEILEYLGKSAGYAAYKPEDGKIFLSKIYILKEFRGSGLFKEFINRLTDVCRQLGHGLIWLTVNKGNLNSIKAYEKAGFVNMGDYVKDIGGGFVMDDYILELKVDNQKL